jgi:hypothetical protein
MGQSEVDLNDRLDLARKNSKTIAAFSPPTAAGRLAAKSVTELRTRVEVSVLHARSVGDLKERVEEEGIAEAEQALQVACE